MIRHEQVTLTLTGTSGNTSTTNPVIGRILAIHFDFSGTMDATADTIVKTVGNGVPSLTILTLTDTNTDGWYFPRHKVHDEAGANISYETTNAKDVYDSVPVADHINVAVAQGSSGKSVTVTILYEQ